MNEPVIIGDATLYLGDCREILPTLINAASELAEPKPVEPGKRINAVITDPPYEAKYEYLYGILSEHSARLLPIGGHLIALCGHHNIQQVLELCSKHLRFWWLCGMKHDTQQRLPGKWVAVTWKPAVWFVKERRRLEDTQCPVDLLNGGGKVKEDHPWGQPTYWFEHWIDRLTIYGEQVLDPFMGSGTTGVACANLGRKFIGIEIEPKYFDIACERISAAYAQQRLFA